MVSPRVNNAFSRYTYSAISLFAATTTRSFKTFLLFFCSNCSLLLCRFCPAHKPLIDCSAIFLCQTFSSCNVPRNTFSPLQFFLQPFSSKL
ncbi:hypothetical protein K435DRAFT_11642 [Dendrothele bispora CBS 962.96]|uniref:Uncharacterized protein n=1 Tax=Dendrothele bispora (strain CBS 962.96) TaxID=1314807 RepID=A0A4S8MYE4_DENBC|nr:hypothetical protein K435DRAFT_11642 [Dendrothele bispora CBS 962.96]